MKIIYLKTLKNGCVKKKGCAREFLWSIVVYNYLKDKDSVDEFYSLFTEFVLEYYDYNEKDFTIDLSGHHLFGDPVNVKE